METVSIRNTYTTLDGDVIDLAELATAQRQSLDQSWAAVEAGITWAEFANHFVTGPGNPLLDPGFRITRETANHPLYLALRDMEDRLGIRQGRLKPRPGDDPYSDPFADTHLTISEAAKVKGVSVRAVYKAIDRRDLVAIPSRPTRVSANSLNRWQVSEIRQGAGRSISAKSPIQESGIVNVHALRDGDTSAFAELFEKSFHSVYRTALGLLGDQKLAEDAAEEVYLAAWTKRHSIPDNWRPWLTRLTRTKALNISKALQRRRKHQRPALTDIPKAFRDVVESIPAFIDDETRFGTVSADGARIRASSKRR